MTNLTLYEIGDQMRELLSRAEELEGMLTDEDLAALDALGTALPQKIDGIAAVRREVSLHVEAIKSEVRRLNSRKKTFESFIDWLDRYTIENMDKAGQTKVEGPLRTLSIQDNSKPSVTITDEDAVPDEYIEMEMRRVVLKNKAIEDWKDSQETLEIPGLRIERGRHVRVHVGKE